MMTEQEKRLYQAQLRYFFKDKTEHELRKIATFHNDGCYTKLPPDKAESWSHEEHVIICRTIMDILWKRKDKEFDVISKARNLEQKSQQLHRRLNQTIYSDENTHNLETQIYQLQREQAQVSITLANLLVDLLGERRVDDE